MSIDVIMSYCPLVAGPDVWDQPDQQAGADHVHVHHAPHPPHPHLRPHHPEHAAPQQHHRQEGGPHLLRPERPQE